jgi:hypothetical protein
MWLYTLHDDVNQRTGKTSIPYDELTQRYSSAESVSTNFKTLDAVERLDSTSRHQNTIVE